MAIISQPYLVDWVHIDAASDLDRLKLVLDVIPDETLMLALEARRGKGRDDYPIRAVWNSILAGVVFGHLSIASLRRELLRNGELRKRCGFNPCRGARAVPPDSAYTHFLDALLDLEDQIRELFHDLVERLKKHLPDLGRFLALDGKALPSFGRSRKKDEPIRLRSDGKADRRADPDADWGVKTKRGVGSEGKAWEKVFSWFGFELHLLVDSQHELPVNFKVTQASTGESPELLPLVQDTKDRHPTLIESAEELSADKGYDSTDNNAHLLDDHQIKAVIDKRSDWKTGDATRPLYEGRVDTVVYDVKGTVKCVCPATGEVRKMEPWGYESDRQGLKYRCPAAVGEYPCQGRDRCPGAQTEYGKIVRIPLEKDRRLFTPIARDSDAWVKAYARRTAVERVNSRIDRVLGFELHTIRGLKKMTTRVCLSLVAVLAMALGRIQAGQRDQMRSMVAPVRKAA